MRENGFFFYALRVKVSLYFKTPIWRYISIIKDYLY